jgi:hypothetical protein
MSDDQMIETSEPWQRYGRAVITSMQGVLSGAEEQHRRLVLETAEHWLSLGVTLAPFRRDDAERLLELIESDRCCPRWSSVPAGSL